MKRFAEEILAKIDAEIRLRDCDVDFAMDNALYMVRFIAPMYEQLREMIVSYSFPSAEDEICFFKELKPEILSKYIYFSKVYHIELKCPDGSNDCIREYLSTELDKLTYFFRNNIEFNARHEIGFTQSPEPGTETGLMEDEIISPRYGTV